ncbi:MAG TPA: oxygen-independent coproporphyrinogen III oxidase [Holophagaceae bacterium]|jgi:oxygen-independent coproporphyrinogen-3 oxidase|nr:oxygen-independent coproporphyrinogen III oxidase [Holophagaceae bacterium]
MTTDLRTLIQRYDKPGPRYTAYPMPPVWNEHLPEADLLEGIKRANGDPSPLSLYAHLPFCRRRCAYCGCNVVVSPHYDPVGAFLESLEREADLWARHLPDRRAVSQMHWGGGTPTYLTVPDLQRTFDLITRRFQLLPGAEVSIEADPTFLADDQLPALRAMGFNRVSFGVQDLDEDVQALITRGQTWDQTLSAVKQARVEGFDGVNLDLVYGLPGQTHDTFRRTLEEVLELNPDRLAVYGFAYLPAMLPYQRSIPAERLPDPEQRLDLLLLASELLAKSGYVAVGMDHFAHPGDPLALAAQDGRLTRNFMGYAVKGGTDMVSIGPSAISEIGGVYHQNDKILTRWEEAVNAGRFAMSKGLVCSQEDLMRRWVIHQLMGRFELRWDELKARWGMERSHFSDAVKQLEAEVPNGVVELSEEGIFVTELGKRFVRNLVMPFDAYLPGVAGKAAFSRTV